MSLSVLHNRKLYQFAGISIIICLFEFLLLRNQLSIDQMNMFSLSSTIDFCIFIPFVYWFFLVRNKHLPAITIVPVIYISYLVAHVIIPDYMQNYLHKAILIIPILEAALFVFFIISIRKLVTVFKGLKGQERFWTDRLITSIDTVTKSKPIAEMIGTEFSIVIFTLMGIFKTSSYKCEERKEFTFHREAGYSTAIAIMIIASIIEIPVLHLIIKMFNEPLAWIISILSIYGLVWIFGDYNAMINVPTIIGEDKLLLNFGLRWRVIIDYNNIMKIHSIKDKSECPKGTLHLAVIGEPKLFIELADYVEFRGLFSIKKKAKYVSLGIDDMKIFMEEMGNKIVHE